MKKKGQGITFVCLPIISAAISSIVGEKLNILWLLLITIGLIFAAVTVLPFCRKRENLWLFVLSMLCLGPINFFVVREYPVWEYFLYSGKSGGIGYYILLIEMSLVATCAESVLVGVVGRVLWRRQYKIYIPGFNEE